MKSENKNILLDKIVLEPGDIDLSRSPMRNLKEETYVLGVFNPGMARLPNGNIVLMCRVAEALRNPTENNSEIKALRWDEKAGYTTDIYNTGEVDTSDPRHILIKKHNPTMVLALTSLSWILPVEMDAEGKNIIKIHYDKIIAPQNTGEEYGIEDARISVIEGKYYMTCCTVSSERHGTTLFSSDDGLNYRREGLVLDHQNKDMLLFEGKIGGKYYAMTRPLGMLYFATAPESVFEPGPGINLAESPDLLHWKPSDKPFIRQWKTKGNRITKLGGGAQPILTDKGWLVLFHGVSDNNNIGEYATFRALLDKNHPDKIMAIDTVNPVLKSQPGLTQHIKELRYLNDVVFTTGIIKDKDRYIVASGELDLCIRITHFNKEYLESIN